ncbi:hypothetical protein C8Q77DRAFT_1152936 [Trametes polyzona]|nr:hypothetical protein C8Q77DRAFT_1152936 [Trametes polyzona]
MPSNKRLRLDPDTDADPDKDKDFWLEDGNIVIIAQKSAFRVHKGVLSRRSEVFSGLFTVPQPEDDDGVEKLEGVPVVRVQDSSHDFRHLLRALYDGIDTDMDERPWAELAALARLAHKYGLDTLLQVTLKRIRVVIPTEYQLWKSYESLESFREMGGLEERAFEIEAYNLLRQCGNEEMALVALEMCTDLSLPTLLHGCQRADGTLEKLPPDDLERCLLAREAISARSARYNSQFADVTSPDREPCTSPALCLPMFRLMRQSIEEMQDLRGNHTEHYKRRMVVRLSVDRYHKGGICSACAEHQESSNSRFCQGLWEDLPAIMGIPVQNWPSAVA